MSQSAPKPGTASEKPVPVVVTSTTPESAKAAPVEDAWAVRARELRKTFRRSDGSEVHALDGVSVDVRRGEIVVLLGPSGCGKTTLLRCIAGLESPDAGEIEVLERVVFSANGSGRTTNVPTEHRKVSMVFQSYALWPHMTAMENVAYPLRAQKVPKAERRARVAHVLELVGIPELGDQYPGQMSGGQQQRVALARAIVGGSGLILFDEPLSNVDARVRDQLRDELLAMHEELRFGAVYVTHDQHEAMELGNRIAVMRRGRVVQYGSPVAVYNEPNSRYVADFLGAANHLDGVVSSSEGDRLEVGTELGPVVATGHGLEVGDLVTVVARPEHCELLAPAPRPGWPNVWPGTIVGRRFLGESTIFSISHGEVRLRVRVPGTGTWDAGDEVCVTISPNRLRAVLQDPDDVAAVASAL